MKKLISVLLTLAILTGCLTCAVSAREGAPDLRIAIASDLHYNQPREVIEGPEAGTIDDPLFWYANRRAAMEDESGFIIDAFLDKCAGDGYDYVLIAGDLADNGRALREEHEDVAAKLAAFEAKTGKQVFVIDGNHDIGNAPATDMHDFKEIYVSTPLETCEQRDIKGLYARARRGEIKDFTGISSPFETPLHPDLCIDTSVLPLEESVRQVVNLII